MSYVPGNDSGDALLIAGAVALAIGMSTIYLRLENEEAGKIVGHCADGTVIGLFKQGVRRRPGRRPEDRERLLAHVPESKAIPKLPELRDDLQPGDLSFARLRYGLENETAWVVEGLDRARESLAIAWQFEDEHEAREVLHRLQERIVRPPLDDQGRAIQVTGVDVEMARERAAQETAPGAEI